MARRAEASLQSPSPWLRRYPARRDSRERSYNAHVARWLARPPLLQLQQRGKLFIARIIARGGQCPDGGSTPLARSVGIGPTQHEAGVIRTHHRDRQWRIVGP